MATVDLRLNFAMRRYSRKYGALEEVTVIIDAGEQNLINTDDYQLVDLKAGDMVLSASANVLVAEGSAVTGQVGFTGGDVDGYIATATLDLNATGRVRGAGAFLTPATYPTVAADDTIDLVTSAAMTTGRFALTFLIERAGELRTGYENYTDDPNNPPQV